MKTKERPILFSTEMVKAILAGRKTQTRRVIKPQPHIDSEGMCKWRDCQWMADGRIGFPVTAIEDYAPYQPGDVLWVRETWCYGSDTHTIMFDPEPLPGDIIYKADVGDLDNDIVKWRPSIYMPREAARLFLQVKDVKVELLQDITEADAIAEGIRQVDSRKWESSFRLGWFDSPILAFKQLWDSINAKRGFGWEINPWVWVVEFEVVDKP